MYNMFDKFNIIALVETWQSQEGRFIIPGCRCYERLGKKSRGRGRPSGGIAIYLKEDTIPASKRINEEREDGLWILAEVGG